LNTIFCANNTVAFNLEKAQYAFIFDPEAEREQPVNYTPEIIATLVANNHRFTVGLEHLNFIDALDGVDVQTLPEQIQCAFCEAWFGFIFEKLEQWRGARIHIEGLKWRPDISENRGYNLYFSLSRRNDKLAAKGHVSMDRQALQWLAEGYAKVNNQGDFPGAGLLPFELCFEMGWMQIESEEFNRLESNDILLPDSCSVNDREKSVLVRLAHGPCWAGNIEHDTITITAAKEIPVGNDINTQKAAPGIRANAAGRPSANRKIADKKNIAGGPGDNAKNASANQGQKESLTAAVVDGLHIDLVFEVGRKKVTLQELKKIKPGYTFDLAAPLERSISVVANGRTVGKGALVQIDQRIGVRLVEIIA
jgi:type III secretion system YscQ/HrcQ family protein